MLSRGEFVAASLEQHTRRGGLDKIVSTLDTRKLGEKHFNFAREHMLATIEAAKEKILWEFRDSADHNPHTSLKNRRLDLYLIYMSVVKQDLADYIPAIQRVSILPDSAVFHDRHIPMRLRAQHLEFRHVQRSAQPLEYHNPPFRFGTAFSLLLSKTLEEQIPADSQGEIPIAIPQPNGMFLGSARRVDPVNYTHITSLYVIHDEKEKKSRKSMIASEWTPSVEITAKTYVHGRDLFYNQRLLHQELIGFYENPQKAHAICRFIDAYAVGQTDILSPPEVNDLDTVLGSLKRITQSKVWEEGLAPPTPPSSHKRPAGQPNNPGSPRL
ncbi:MAG: hypothetical protein WBK91_00240 [Alphaproteobacteria bacterium]